MEIVRLYAASTQISGGCWGLPLTAPMNEHPLVRVKAGHGVVGDRCFCEKIPHLQGQVTFFSEEVWWHLLDELGVPQADPIVLDRNILVRGADLPALIGRHFTLQGVHFEGVGYCEPHSLLDEAVWPGAVRQLTAWKAGGLRALALTGGVLVCDAALPPSRDGAT